MSIDTVKPLFLKLLLLSSALLAYQHAMAVSKADLDLLYARAHEAANATKNGDASTVADLTYPAVVAIMGGKQQIVELTRRTMETLKAQNVELVSLDMEPAQCIERIPQHDLCFMPKQTTFRIGDKLKRKLSFLVAVRDSTTAGQWLFLDGAIERQNPGILRKILPWIPNTTQFPAVSEE